MRNHYAKYMLLSELVLQPTSAPLAPGIASAIFRIFIPRIKFIFREWIFKMSARAFSSGAGNSILRSILPKCLELYPISSN